MSSFVLDYTITGTGRLKKPHYKKVMMYRYPCRLSRVASPAVPASKVKVVRGGVPRLAPTLNVLQEDPKERDTAYQTNTGEHSATRGCRFHVEPCSKARNVKSQRTIAL